MSVRIGLSVPRRNKTKQASWPLSSNKNSSYDLSTNITKKPLRQRITGMRGTGSFYVDDTPKLDILTSGKEITVTVQRGTKKFKNLPDSVSSKHSTIIHHSFKKHVCDTCNEEIDSEISRILIMQDKDGGPRLLCFHFFFPCWDLNLLCQKYPYLIINKLGFSFPENITMEEKSIKDMQENLEFWN